MGKLCGFLVLNIFMYSFIYAGFFSQLLNYICIKAIRHLVCSNTIQMHACIGLHNAPINTTAGAYISAVRSSFRLGGGGLKVRAEGTRKFLNLESLNF